MKYCIEISASQVCHISRTKEYLKEIPWKPSWAMDKLPENLIPAMAVGKPQHPHPNQRNVDCDFTLCTTSPIGKQDF